MSIRAVKPWAHNAECPLPNARMFKKHLDTASYHNAADGGREFKLAREAMQRAVSIAISERWPLWAMRRMFNEHKPLVAYDEFVQSYITTLMRERDEALAAAQFRSIGEGEVTEGE